MTCRVSYYVHLCRLQPETGSVKRQASSVKPHPLRMSAKYIILLVKGIRSKYIRIKKQTKGENADLCDDDN